MCTRVVFLYSTTKNGDHRTIVEPEFPDGPLHAVTEWKSASGQSWVKKPCAAEVPAELLWVLAKLVGLGPGVVAVADEPLTIDLGRIVQDPAHDGTDHPGPGTIADRNAFSIECPGCGRSLVIPEGATLLPVHAGGTSVVIVARDNLGIFASSLGGAKIALPCSWSGAVIVDAPRRRG
jgi:hypothetical protein